MTSDTLHDADATESRERASHYRYPGAPPFADDDLDRQLFQGRAAEAETVLHSILSRTSSSCTPSRDWARHRY